MQTSATWCYVVPHGSEIEFSADGRVTVRHPKYPTLRVRALEGRLVLSAITTAGHRLERRP